MLESPVRPGFDLEAAASTIEGFIASAVRGAGASGAVLGVSGGVDSALVLALSSRALGPGGVLALVMPDSRLTPREDVADARSLCDLFGARRVEHDIAPIHAAYVERLPPSMLAEGNLRARIRMGLLYYYANLENRIVVGTGDRSEYLLGYFTKYGDGGVDIAPILGLYKTEVRALARALGVPESVAGKGSSPRLWPGQTAEDELGFPYAEADVILHRIFDLGEPVDRVRESNPRLVDAVMDWHRRTEHKRAPVPSPALSL
ncbi:MAG: NAD+ synthase [Nitrososphaeria archaeon]|jgi:NAD+ synthase